MTHNNPSKKAKHNRTDQEKLELFISKANELRQTKLATNGFSFKHNIHFEIGQPLQSKLDQPSEADLLEYLPTFRKFISEREDTFLEHVLNICSKRLTVNEMKKNIAQVREAYKKVKLDNAASLYWDNKRYTPLQITDIYLNSVYFHSDLEYQEILDNASPPLDDILRSYFLNFLINASKLILIISNNIEYGLKENLFNLEN